MRFVAALAVLLVFFANDCGPAAAASTVGDDKGKAVLAAPAALPSHGSSGVSESTKDQPSHSSEEVLLKRELALVMAFQSDVLATVYWSLGVLGGIALLLVGFGWFSNFKVYERDKQTLVTDVTTAARHEIAVSEQNQRAALVSERERADAAVADLRAEFRQRVDEAIANERAANAGNDKRLEDYVDKAVAKIQKHTDGRIAILQLQLSRMKRQSAVKEKMFSMVVSYAFDELQESLVVESEYFIKDALEAIVMGFKEGGAITKNDLERATRLLSEIPKELSMLRDSVSEQLKTARVNLTD